MGLSANQIFINTLIRVLLPIILCFSEVLHVPGDFRICRMPAEYSLLTLSSESGSLCKEGVYFDISLKLNYDHAIQWLNQCLL